MRQSEAAEADLLYDRLAHERRVDMQMIFPRAIRLATLAFAVGVHGCSLTVDQHPVFLGTVCEPYPSTIGRYIKVGASADEVLERVGLPNKRRQEKDLIYYVYRIQPFPTRRLAGGLCSSKPIDGSSSYDVAFGTDRKIDSVVYVQLSAIDPDHVDLPDLLPEQGMVVATSICLWNGKGDDRECPGSIR